MNNESSINFNKEEVERKNLVTEKLILAMRDASIKISEYSRLCKRKRNYHYEIHVHYPMDLPIENLTNLSKSLPKNAKLIFNYFQPRSLNEIKSNVVLKRV